MDKYKEINKILKEWNPLGVIGPALSDEYIGLIPSILEQKNESDLENFFTQKMSLRYGVVYEDLNIAEKEEFKTIIKRISNFIR
jgi:hypothetical protein